MKRSVQEIIELLVFGLIAVLIGTGVLWLVGWAIGGLGALFKLLAGLIWSLLRFVVPIAVVGAAVYALVRLLQGQRGPEAATSTASSGTAASAGSPKATTAKPTSAPPPAEATSTKAVEPSPKRAAVVEEKVADDEGEEADDDERPKQASAQGEHAAPEHEGDGESDNDEDERA